MECDNLEDRGSNILGGDLFTHLLHFLPFIIKPLVHIKRKMNTYSFPEKYISLIMKEKKYKSSQEDKMS